MTRHYDGAPIARHLVFILRDGTFVVQWDADRVQDLLSGRLLPFQDSDYGHPVSDADLERLREAGRVSHFDRAYVWLHALPEQQRFSEFSVREETTGRTRYFYVNTILPESELARIEHSLQELGLHTRFRACEQGGLVAIMNQDGQPFSHLSDAEYAQDLLRQAAPQLLQDATVAFVEFDTRRVISRDDRNRIAVADLDTLIASQTERIADPDRTVVGIDNDEEFLSLAAATMRDLGVAFVPVATSGQDGLVTVEDLVPDLVVMSLVMPDIHAWQILARMRANQALAHIPVIIVSAQGTQSDQIFALTVAKVHDFLPKPVAPSELRRSVWMALHPR
ncbi:MAG: response regulator [Anaerolineae bacterium]|nr:response regulator [Anaerolineae bacterium]